MNDHFDWDIFLRRHYASLCAVAYNFVGSLDVAEDIVQKVMIKFWERRKKDKTIESPDDYLFIMTRNESLNHLRSRQKRLLKGDAVYFKESEDPVIINKMIKEETTQLLLQAIRLLPEQSSRIMELTLSGHKNKEIANLLGISLNTVKTLKHASICKLREYFLNRNIRLGR